MVTEFTGGVTPGFSFDSEPFGITAGPDGNLWFTEYRGSRIARITPAGVVTEFSLPAPNRQPSHITAGPDGNLWFTEGSPGGIGRITTAGVVTEFLGGSTPGFTANRIPSGITTGADGNLWFTETRDPGAVVRVSLPSVTPTPTPTASPEPEAPSPTPSPDPSTPPGPAPAQPPRVTAVISGAPVVTGSSALLSAQVLGSAQHLDWDLNGDGKTEVSCPGDQPTLTFRPAASTGGARASAFAGRVTVQAVGAAGAGPPLSESFPVAPTPPAQISQPIKDAVTKVVAGQPPVYVCGLARDFAASQTELTAPPGAERQHCYGRTVDAGILRVSGCLMTVDDISDIPRAERGIVQELARTIGVGPVRPSTILKKPDLVLGAIDGYVASGPVLVNGVEIDPGAGASIVIYSQVDRILSSNAAMNVGGIVLDHRKAFSLDTRPEKGASIPLGDFKTLPGPIEDLGAFAMVGDLGVTLIPGTPGAPAGAKITTELELPSWLSFGGSTARARVTLTVTGDGRLKLEDMHIELPDVDIGLMKITDLQLDFKREDGDSVWHGQGQFCLLERVCVNAAEEEGVKPPGGVVIRNGELDRAHVNVTFNPGIPLYPNVDLTHVGAGAGRNPTRLLGGIGVTAIGIYRINGTFVMAFPSAATPYQPNRDEISGLTDQDYDHAFTRFTLAASGEAALRVDALDQTITLGRGHFVYQWPGYVRVGGEIRESFAGIVTLTGRTNGEFNLGNGRFNFGQDIEACVLDYFCRGAYTRLSSVGVGACATVNLGAGSVSIGGGVQFRPFKILLSPFDGCRWSEFEDAAVFDGKAAAAQATGAITVKIKKGDRSRSIRLDGADGAPRVRVTAPGGQTLDSPEGPGTALTPAIRILRSQQIKATVIGLQDPKPGTYQLDLLPGSPAITKVTEAEDPPPARVSARVTGRGAKRTLDYDVLRRPGQKVTFVEVAGGAKRPIGTVTGGRGRLRFTPAPGTDRRRIEAQFELVGIGAETKTVAAFTPPSPRLDRPTRLSVRRRASRLVVTWKRVADAARYELVTTLNSGEQRITRTRRPAATITRVARSSGGRVTVRAIAPMRQGQAAAARFRATAPRTSPRFRPLPKLKRAGG